MPRPRMSDLRMTRRQMLARGLTTLAGGASLVLLAACQQQAPPAKPTAAGAAPAANPTQAAPAAKTESKPAEVTKPAAEQKPAAGAPQAAAAKPGESPKRGGTLEAVVQNDFVTMWPALTTGPTAHACFDSLVRWRKGADDRWGPAPGLAESWELTDRAAVFKLRRGVKFHDGSDLNAEAVRWNVETWIKHPKSIAKAELEQVATDTPAEVVDDYTVKINLVGPSGSLLAAISDATNNSGIVSKAAHERLGDDGLTLQAVGTGPFAFEQWQSGSQLVVKRNESYWEQGVDGQSLPYLEKIRYRFVPDDSVRLVELRSGSAHFADLIRGRDVPAVQAEPSLTFVEDPGVGNRYRLFFNGKRGPFANNLKLRQAVYTAIDREAIAKALGAGRGVPQYYDLTPGTIGYDESLPHYSFDLDKAKALMAESGVSTPLEVRLTVITREADQQQAQLIQAMLDKVGITVNIEGLERVAWGQKVRRENDFEMATQRTSSALDPDLLSLYWAPEGPAAYVRANEPSVIQCLDEGRSTYDQQKRHEIYRRCQIAMHETAWWNALWLQPWNWVYNKRVKNVPPMYASFWREEQFWLDS